MCVCTALTGFSVSQGCRPHGGARARDPLSAPVSLLSACRCQVRISPQPFPGTRMYVACYIPEPTMYGAFTASVVFVLLRENCRRAHSGEQRDSIRCLYDIRASIEALGETIRSFLVKKKERERERARANRTTKHDKQNSPTKLSKRCRHGGDAPGSDRRLGGLDFCPGWSQVLLPRTQSLLSEGRADADRLCRGAQEPGMSGSRISFAVVFKSIQKPS